MALKHAADVVQEVVEKLGDALVTWKEMEILRRKAVTSGCVLNKEYSTLNVLIKLLLDTKGNIFYVLFSVQKDPETSYYIKIRLILKEVSEVIAEKSLGLCSHTLPYNLQKQKSPPAGH